MKDMFKSICNFTVLILFVAVSSVFIGGCGTTRNFAIQSSPEGALIIKHNEKEIAESSKWSIEYCGETPGEKKVTFTLTGTSPVRVSFLVTIFRPCPYGPGCRGEGKASSSLAHVSWRSVSSARKTLSTTKGPSGRWYGFNHRRAGWSSAVCKRDSA